MDDKLNEIHSQSNLVTIHEFNLFFFFLKNYKKLYMYVKYPSHLISIKLLELGDKSRVICCCESVLMTT